MGYPSSSRQACTLRDAAAREAEALLASEPPQDPIARARRAAAFAALVKAWESACERLRIARGVPLPGSRTPAERTQRKRATRTQPRMDVPIAPDHLSPLADTPPKPKPLILPKPPPPPDPAEDLAG
jgi:hypothetical protein